MIKQLGTTLILLPACVLTLIAGSGQAQPAKDNRGLDAAATREREMAIRGAFGGIGAELAKTNRLLLIKAALAGGPAARTGLSPGTAIVRINDLPTADMSLNDAVKLLRGPEGTIVTLDVRDPSGKAQRVELTREKVIVGRPEASLCATSIGLVRLSAFNDETARATQEAVAQLQTQGAKALVLDLRGAGGGSVAALQQVASLFLPRGAGLWLLEQNSGERTLAKAAPSASPITLPLAVLVDERTQAAELLAGAIKRNQRGPVIGRRTSGQAASKSLVKNPDGSSRLVPFGRFLLSPGEPISGVGVAPDLELPANAQPAEFVRAAITELQKRLQSGASP